MLTFFTIISVLQSFSISLGVGSSTLAIVSFFVAIADGSINPDERKMMGVVYIVLRIAMILILVTTLCLFATQFQNGTLFFSAFDIAQFTVIGVLFVNAMLMTAHLIPSNFGPAIQAGNWYTLGTLSALSAIGITGFTTSMFFFSYITWLVLAVSIVNGVMAIQMARRHKMLK